MSKVLRKRTTARDKEIFAELLDSKTVLISYNTTDPGVALNLTKDVNSYKLYLADTGLFTTLLFHDESKVYADIYAKLLGDKLSANLGYLYENAVAQIIAATNRKLYYHTWRKSNSTHSYEVDFLLSSKTKIVPLEIKSSSVRYHESISVFAVKYSAQVSRQYLLSQKDVKNEGMLMMKPIYMLPFILEEL